MADALRSSPATRAKDAANTVVPLKSRDDLTKDNLTIVKDSVSGKRFLENKGYTITGEPVTLDSLSLSLLHLSQHRPLSRLVIDGIRAVAFLIQEAEDDGRATAIAAAVIAKMTDTTADLNTTLAKANEVAEELRSSAVSLNGTANEFVCDIESATQGFQETLDAIPDVTAMAAQSQALPPVVAPASYLAAARSAPDAACRAIIEKSNNQARQILIDRAPNAESNALAGLTEVELTAKAALALDMMGMAAEDAPPGTKFLGAHTLRNGGVIYELNSAEAANWLRTPEVMTTFIAHFGGTSVIKPRTYATVVEYVPTTFDPFNPRAFEDIEDATGLKRGDVQGAKWIKPIERRTPSQRTAHLIVTFANPEAANHAMWAGLFIERKKVHARKLQQEPKRCLKCQSLAGHMAAECSLAHDVCGSCGGNHRTNGCNNGANQLRCINCNERGHAAWDRSCPTFLAKARAFRGRHPENKYRYFPTDDPVTWELADSEWTEVPAAQNEGWQTVERRGTSGRSGGSGRLTGGAAGAGGGSSRRRVASKAGSGWSAGAGSRPGFVPGPADHGYQPRAGGQTTLDALFRIPAAERVPSGADAGPAGQPPASDRAQSPAIGPLPNA